MIENPSYKNLWYVYDDISKYFKIGSKLNSTLETGVETLKIVNQIVNQISIKNG